MDKTYIGEMTRGTSEFWEFIATPIWLLLILLSVFAFVNRVSFERIASTLRGYTTWLYSLLSEADEGKQKRNLTVSFIVLFALLTILHIIQATVHLIGSPLPPHLSYRSDFLLLESVKNKDDLVLIWSRFPSAASLNDLSGAIDQSIGAVSDKSDDRIKRNMAYHEKDMGSAYVRFAAVKFLFLWVVASLLLGYRYRPNFSPSKLRALLLILLLVPIGLYIASDYYFWLEQIQFDKNRLILAGIATQSDQRPELHQELLERVAYDTSHNARWWIINWSPFHNFDWFLRTFVRSDYNSWYKQIKAPPLELGTN